ncbi:hypothetical protein PL599_11100 [Agrobacterium sp. ST15.16.055]|nr:MULTISPECIES: hypothetical protein [Agrobacterium]MCZ7889057.1 hypothetical protein [Agrobacterium salinitolerans]MDA5629219.1 hypothetical protein [Agrobacterium sp. ST15.16.055]MDA6981940.1 hypothetical protein [Agrobacterium salinitolerans]
MDILGGKHCIEDGVALGGRNFCLAWHKFGDADFGELAAHGIAAHSEARTDRRHADRIEIGGERITLMQAHESPPLCGDFGDWHFGVLVGKRWELLGRRRINAAPCPPIHGLKTRAQPPPVARVF